MNLIIRKGQNADIEAVFGLILELAQYEKAVGQVINTPEKMLEQRNFYDFLVAETDGKVVGAAIYFFSYSTWKGRSIYLDDIIVTESMRGKGIGSKLFEALIEIARSEKVGKLHWQVLDWNEPAIRFYRRFGAEFDSEWINCKIERFSS